MVGAAPRGRPEVAERFIAKAVMRHDPEKHHRRSIRLRGYDYTRAGAYFVTIVTQDRQCLFGEVTNKDMRLNDAVHMAQTAWDELPAHYPGVDIDGFAVMSNHIHGIIVLVGAPPRGRPNVGQATNTSFETNRH